MSNKVQRATMYAWDTTALQVTLRARAELHVHAAVQVTVGLDGPLRMGGESGPTIEGRCVLVAANEPHWFECDVGWISALWLEPHCLEARRLTSQYLDENPIVALPAEPAEHLVKTLRLMKDDTLDAAGVASLRDELAWAWISSEERPPFHPAVSKAIRAIDSSNSLDLSASDLAAASGVSETYLMQLFSKHLGTPIRQFVRWRRMWRAMEEILVHGATATEAAHAAGFSDLSHLSKVCKRLLDVSPGEVTQYRDAVQFHRISVSDDSAAEL